MRVVKKKVHVERFILRLAVLAFVVYIAVLLVDQQVQINAKKKESAMLDQQIQVLELQNADMYQFIESDDEENEEYVIRAARKELDFAHQGERVFITIAGN